MTRDRWSRLGRIELLTVGKALVPERLERLGCTGARASNPIDGKLEVRTASGRSLEVFVPISRRLPPLPRRTSTAPRSRSRRS